MGRAGGRGGRPREQDGAGRAPGMPQPPQPGSGPVPEAGPGREGAPEPGPGAGTGQGGHGGGGAGDRAAGASADSSGRGGAARYAGAMRPHAFAGRAGACQIPAAADAGGPARPATRSAGRRCAGPGRAVGSVPGEPSGLAVALRRALAELTKAAGPAAQIMVGFDRGGAYAQVFRHCRDQQVHWVTYRRAPLAVPAMLPVITTITAGGRARQVTWAEETADIKDYRQARQITLFEHGKVVLQVLTSDMDACPAQILAWLKSRWRG